jgi:hypothetical protein
MAGSFLRRPRANPASKTQAVDETLASTGGSPPEGQEVRLSDAAKYLVDEARMVLPGTQALFGFQLIAVFNSGFAEKLTPGEQGLHLLAITLVVLAIALVMAPAAYHRQIGPRHVTEAFIRTSTHLLLWSMAPLAVGISLDFYLVSRVILNRAAAWWLAAGMFAVLIGFWFVLPQLKRHDSSGPAR